MVGFRDLASIAIIFVIAGVALGIGAQVLEKVSGQIGGTSTAAMAVNNSTEGINELAQWMPTIGLVIAAAMIIGIIFSSFGGRV